MKKRLFAIMLALVMLLAAVPALAEEGDGREAPESTKKICLNCKAKDKVNEEGLCEKCVSNLKQDNTQQKMITSLKTLNEDNTEGGANGGGTGDNNGDNTGGDPGNNAGNTDNNGGNTSGEAGDNNGESNNPDSTDSSGSTGGDTGTGGATGGSTGGATEGGTTGGGETGGETDGGSTGTGDSGTTPTTCTHTWGAPVWAWSDNYSVAMAIFTCTRNCGYSETETASVVRSSINSCGYYTYTATVKFNGETYTNTRTDYSCRPDWYYDPCYYNNPCGHWGCGNVCTRYSNCVPCQNYRTTFRVGGYNCLATPKTGDVSVIGMALISLAGAGAAIMGKKRK